MKHSSNSWSIELSLIVCSGRAKVKLGGSCWHKLWPSFIYPQCCHQSKDQGINKHIMSILYKLTSSTCPWVFECKNDQMKQLRSTNNSELAINRNDKWDQHQGAEEDQNPPGGDSAEPDVGPNGAHSPPGPLGYHLEDRRGPEPPRGFGRIG